VTDEPVGVGLVGYGVSAASLHAPLITAEPRLALRAVVSSDPDRVHGDLAVRVVPAVADLLGDPAIELVVVAVPNEAHAEVAAAALSAGRHVVVDKPFTVTTAEADALIALAGSRDRLIAVFHQRRWDSDYLTVRRCVHDGLLGTVNTYLARYDRYRPVPADQWRDQARPGAGVLYDLGAHLIDQAVHLFGMPESVTADVRIQRAGASADDYFHVVLGYGPLRVILHAGSLVPAPRPRFEVHGDAGSYVSGGIDGQIAALLAGRRPGDPGWGVEPPDRYGTLTTVSGTAPGSSPIASVTGAYESFYRAMADAVRGRGPVPVTAQEGRATVWIIERCLESSASGRTVTGHT
jgi:scyllo-inositol 2-dehydrogenase (NADP+)